MLQIPGRSWPSLPHLWGSGAGDGEEEETFCSPPACPQVSEGRRSGRVRTRQWPRRVYVARATASVLPRSTGVRARCSRFASLFVLDQSPDSPCSAWKEPGVELCLLGHTLGQWGNAIPLCLV